MNADFCPHCSNLLYPRESHADSLLMLFCNSCNFSEFAEVDDVARNTVDMTTYNYHTREDIKSYVSAQLVHDPTLPRDLSWLCDKCQAIGAVYVQIPENLVQEEAMVMVYICLRPGCERYEIKGTDAPRWGGGDEATQKALPAADLQEQKEDDVDEEEMAAMFGD